MSRKKRHNSIAGILARKKIRLVDVDGNQIGIMNPREALCIAQEKELELVEVAPNRNIPSLDWRPIADTNRRKSHGGGQEREGRRQIGQRNFRLPTRGSYSLWYSRKDRSTIQSRLRGC